jgi:hypothetical protein
MTDVCNSCDYNECGWNGCGQFCGDCPNKFITGTCMTGFCAGTWGICVYDSALPASYCD